MATASEQELAKLREDIEQLRADMGSLVESLKAAGIGQGRDALNRARQTGESLKSEAEELQRRAEAQISERPITSALTSFGLGFLIGMLLDRRH